MPDFDNKELFLGMTAEAKLKILLHEMTLPLAWIHGHGELLEKYIQSDAGPELPNDFKTSVDEIIKVSSNLRTILAAVRDSMT